MTAQEELIRLADIVAHADSEFPAARCQPRDVPLGGLNWAGLNRPLVFDARNSERANTVANKLKAFAAFICGAVSKVPILTAKNPIGSPSCPDSNALASRSLARRLSATDLRY